MKSIIVITKSVTEELITEELITKELIAGNLHLYVRYVLNTEHEAQAIIEITTVTIELIKFIVPTVKNFIYYTSFYILYRMHKYRQYWCYRVSYYEIKCPNWTPNLHNITQLIIILQL